MKTECKNYAPDIQAQGDCINCGHPWENHQIPKVLKWNIGEFHGQQAYVSECGQYNVFWSDDACRYLADAPNTNQHGGWETAREAKDAMQKYETNGQSHCTTHTVEIDSDVLASQIMDNDVQRFVCVGIKPVRGDTIHFEAVGHKLATVVVSGVDTVELRPTDMSLNGRQLFSIIHDRDADLTDNEFATECGFEGYMELVEWARDAAGVSRWGDDPIRAVCVRWSV